MVRIDGETYLWYKSIANGGTIGARIVLEIEMRDSLVENVITEEYSGKGFIGQGYIDEVPETGYDIWKTAVKQGLVFGFSKMEKKWIVRVKRLEALITDASATVVGYVAMRAFWEKAGYVPGEEEILILEKFVVSSCNIETYQSIPDFFSLTLNDKKC